MGNDFLIVADAYSSQPCLNWLAIQLESVQSFSLSLSHYDLSKTQPHVVFYIHGSVHRNSILIRSNKMQQYASIYLLQNYSTSFGCLSHPSSGVHQTVTAASGTGHITYQGNDLLPAWPN